MIYRLSKTLLLAFLLTSITSAWGNDVTPFGPPSAPTTVTASLSNPSSTTSTDINIEWSGTNAAGSTITGYQVTPYEGPGYTTTATVSCSTPGPGTSDSCTVSGLAYASTYKFKVSVTTAAGSATSSFSNEVTTNSQAQTVTISGAPNSYTYGDPAFQLTATATSGLSVAWSIPSTTDICSVDLSGTVQFLKSGSCTIRATQDGSGSAYASAYSEVTVTSTSTLSATLGTATSVQSSQATLNAVVPFPGVDVTPSFCVSRTNSNSSCSLPSGVSIGSYSPSTVTSSSGSSVSAVASGLSQNTTYYFWITVSASGATPYTTSTGSFTTVSGPAISYSGSTSGTVGTAMTGTLTASSGSGVYAAWSSASLPTGLTFNPGVTPTTSTISGTPTSAGTSVALFTVTDSSGLESQLNVTFVISAAPTTDPGTGGSSAQEESPSEGSGGSGTGGSGGAGPGATSPGDSEPSAPSIPPTPTAPKNQPLPPTASTDGGSSNPGEGSSPGNGGVGSSGILSKDSIGESIRITPNENRTGLLFEASNWSIDVRSESQLVQDARGEPDSRLATEFTGSITISGSGFRPRTQVDFYAYSEPIWLGAAITDENGLFEFPTKLPRSVAVGEHILQVIGSSPEDKLLVANLPLLVLDRRSTNTFIPNTLIAKTTKGPNRTSFRLNDIPSKSTVTWKSAINKNTRGVASASIRGRFLSVTPSKDFSGIILLTAQIKNAGITVNRDLSLTVLPLAPKAPLHTLSGLNRTKVTWLKSNNAISYEVLLNDFVICETKKTSCNYKGIAGPNSNFKIRSIGDDGTSSNDVTSKYIQSKSGLLATVNFDTGSSELNEQALASLQELIPVILREGFSSIEIIGYTDSVGRRAANQKLSEARARAVFNFITGNVVGAVDSIGKGKKRPIKSNATKEGRASNRRVEIFVR